MKGVGRTRLNKQVLP